MKRAGPAMLIVVALMLTGCSLWRTNLTHGVPSVCAVHGMPMVKTEVPIQYGLLGVTSWRKAYAAASTEDFPNAEEIVEGGCIVRNVKRALIYVCRECQRARHQWISEHPAPRRYTENSVAGEWVGFYVDGGTEVFRLFLRPNATGLLTSASTSPESTNGVFLCPYELSKWSITTNDTLECEFHKQTPYDASRMTGTFNGDNGISATIYQGQGDGKWNVLFWRMSDLEGKLKAMR